ncbi:hypothetical protein [Bdellovibrio bacteriovorus]|uniref:Uncharacterized protein n=1 Tax=Bdellovibrio bacteriovorus str. Tiberius TaxID=1069642 RepID=K7Z6X4_BDEBC|nr:hypothetical protein [Bdellovibrio bacteriovorus]AFX99948.1 Hypothetical protein Bdt_0240 [Bdellovibrio bacteriovorus str. Tiberius]
MTEGDKSFQELSRRHDKLEWLVEKLKSHRWPVGPKRLYWIDALARLSQRAGTRELFESEDGSFMPEKPYHEHSYAFQRDAHLEAFNNSYENTLNKVLVSKTTSADFKVLILDEYLKFLARNHFAFSDAKSNAPLTAASFLFPDIEQLKVSWLPTLGEKELVGRLREERIRLVAESRNKKRKDAVRIGYKVSQAVLGDPFFPLSFKLVIQFIISNSSGLDMTQRKSLLGMQLSDVGDEIFKSKNYDPHQVDNRSRIQFQKDIIFAYFYGCLRNYGSTEATNSLPLDFQILSQTLALIEEFHPDYKLRITGIDSIKSIVSEFDEKALSYRWAAPPTD